MTASSQRSKIILAGVLFAILAVVTVIVVATGGDDGSGSAISTDTSTKPTIPASSDPPPTDLVSKDIVVGDGATAEKGDQLTVQYVGADYTTGVQFDASWDNGQPLPLQLGAGQVIAGWDQGLVGMKVGGRRELIIPPDLGYGAQGQPPSIQPNETLVFVIDLLDAKKPSASAGASAAGG
jgi:peptidylprolyl isomerase